MNNSNDVLDTLENTSDTKSIFEIFTNHESIRKELRETLSGNADFIELYDRLYAEYGSTSLQTIGLGYQNFIGLSASGGNEKGELLGIFDGEIVDADSMSYCDECDCYALSDQIFSVTTRNYEERAWCQSCVDNHTFRDHQGVLWDSRCFSEIECDGDTLCRQSEEENIYYWDSDESYHYDPEPEDNEDNPRLGYHDRNWDHKLPQVPFYCLEIEVEAKDHSSLDDLCMDTSNKWYATEDGSLDDDLGVELVVRPILDSELKETCSTLFGSLPSFCKGHDAGSEYGMHINISKEVWGIDSVHLGKMLVLIYRSKKLMEVLAQRHESRWAMYHPKKIEDGNYSSPEKYEALHVEGDRLEFRIFRSNTRIDRIVKNCQVVKSLVEFTKQIELIDQLTPDNYLSFIKESPYEELKSFIDSRIQPDFSFASKGDEKLLVMAGE